ncbi:2-oxo-4-hydroxy-4-carboxy-5-ureidoimidazoline decarboxylase [Arcobacteraceae bacterium]|nr:2-oxo-4-hydroxy-4-carboxy-5-ureidoimidazoline decarboxylase [Arcobacteraceae bacterium]
MKTPYQLSNENEELFLSTFNDLYEHSSWVILKALNTIKSDKKYDQIDEFHKLLSTIVLNEDKELQDSLIQAHPMLAGKKAMANELTDFSTNEQKSAGLNTCTNEEIEIFDNLNKTYFDKFGFPFIFAVKGKSKEQILENFKSRINNSLEKERVEALEQINKIGLIRIKDIYEH